MRANGNGNERKKEREIGFSLFWLYVLYCTLYLYLHPMRMHSICAYVSDLSATASHTDKRLKNNFIFVLANTSINNELINMIVFRLRDNGLHGLWNNITQHNITICLEGFRGNNNMMFPLFLLLLSLYYSIWLDD
jgi:hypothetical protein